MLNKHSIIWLLTTCILLFAGCSDDFYAIDNDRDEEPFKDGLTIFVPRSLETRDGEVKATTNELTLTSLTLFLIQYENGEYKDLIVKQLKDNRTAVKVTAQGYEAYNIENLPQGDYKVYICANIFNSSEDKDETLKTHFINAAKTANRSVEEEILSRTYNFGKAYFNYDINSTDNNLKVHGLPMSCMHGTFRTDKDDKTKVLGTGYFKFTGNETLYADMTFALAKVTVAVEGAAGDNIDIDKVTLSHYLKKFTLFETKNFTGIDVDQDTDPHIELTTRKDLVANPVYVSETNGTNDPKLTLEYEDKKIEIPLGEENTTSHHHDIVRGNHYEYVVKRDGTISLNVYRWVPVTLETEFGGPFYLRISSSKIESMKSGVKYAMTFSTDVTAENFSLEAPKYVVGSNEYPAFIFEKNFREGSFTVQINDAIPLSVWQDEEQSKGLRYFHVVANNLKKRVEVEKIVAEPSFTVNPQTIVIDLRELIAGGYSEYLYNVDYASNIGTVQSTWSSARWKDASGNNLDSYESAEVANIFVPTAPTASASGTDGVNVYQLDQGITFYADRKYLEVTYEVVMPADASADDMTQYNKLKANNGHKKTVRYTVIPYSSNYIIHFRSDVNEGSWTAPHIYAYQCLELPVDLKGTNAKYAGKTVGDGQAALKYCFTTGFAFKGWKGYGGPDTNDPNAEGTWGRDANNNVLNDGFFKFSSGTTYLPNTGDVNGSPLNTTRYEWFGFNNAHYKNLIDAKQGKNQPNSKCSTGHCATDWNPTPGESTEAVRMWPGIIMQKEQIDGKTWWRYELSGVAEPGKTLIMFSNLHTGEKYNNQDVNRFPGNNKVGVPLFDYEDKEGWFVLKNTDQEDYTTNHFSDDNPYASNGESGDDGPGDTDDTHILICWSNDCKQDNQVLNRIYMEYKEGETIKSQPFGDWGDGGKEKYDANGKYWVWVPVSNFSYALNNYVFQLNNNNNKQCKHTPFTSDYYTIKTDIDNLDGGLKNKLKEDNVTVTRYYEITKVEWWP